jgi:predicted aspartyl protease
MTSRHLVSFRFPYIPVRVQVRQRTEELEALLDTGFDDDVVVPASWRANGQPPNGHVRLELGDGSLVTAPYCNGTVELAGLGTYPVVVSPSAMNRSSAGALPTSSGSPWITADASWSSPSVTVKRQSQHPRVRAELPEQRAQQTGSVAISPSAGAAPHPFSTQHRRAAWPRRPSPIGRGERRPRGEGTPP